MSLINQSYKRFGVLSNCLNKNDMNKNNSLFKNLNIHPLKIHIIVFLVAIFKKTREYLK